MKTYRYMIGMLLCVWLLAACDNSNAFDEYAKFDTTAQTAWGQSIVDGSNGYVAHVKDVYKRQVLRSMPRSICRAC